MTKVARPVVIPGGLELLAITRASGASPGSNTVISISASPSAASMRLLTSGQFNLPKPLPNGGIAMELMPLVSITLRSSVRPVLMSSIRLFPRQCRLVGKLTMKRGVSSAWRSEINILPGTTSPRSQATLYSSKLRGNAFLNCRAIPRLITPTQFTVFTNASASLRRMSPDVYRIIGVPLNVPPNSTTLGRSSPWDYGPARATSRSRRAQRHLIEHQSHAQGTMKNSVQLKTLPAYPL